MDPDRGAVPDPGRSRVVWDVLGRWRAAGRRFALLTVTGTRGFTPRKAGAHMLLGEDGETAGTIGGGAIEQEALAQARALLAEGGATAFDRHLTRELGMCCGGEMSVFVEIVEPAPRLFVLGAGFIGEALARQAGACGFEVTVVDAREEWARAERFPGARLEWRDPEAYARSLEPRPTDFAVIVTHDHALDQRLVEALLRRPLRFLGMVGSIPKQRKFALRLRARGFSDAEIARLHTPLGLQIGAETPEEIAVSVLAQLVAVRRGMPVSPGWTPPGGARYHEVAEPARAEPATDSRREPS